MAKGCDYSWERPNIGGLVQAGYQYVIRYVSHDNTGKNLSVAEAGALRASGLDIGLVWEFGKMAPLNGHAQGVADAANAINMAVALGAPSHAAIYFAVDFDAQDSDMHAIAQYVDGCTATIGWDRVGVYGGYKVIANMAATNRCKYFWQTYAWSYGNWHPAAQLRQVQNEVPVAGDRIDIDQSFAADIGSWNGPIAPGGGSTNTPDTWDPTRWITAVGDAFKGGADALTGFRAWIDGIRDY